MIIESENETILRSIFADLTKVFEAGFHAKLILDGKRLKL